MKNENKVIYEVLYKEAEGEKFAYFDSYEEARSFAQMTVNKEWLSTRINAWLTGFEVSIPYYYTYSTAEQLMKDIKNEKVVIDEYDDELGFSHCYTTIMEEVIKETFKEMRIRSGMTQAEFSEYFEIPKRTIENWESETNKCPDYLRNLMEYKLRKENIIK
jgi:DNA-binding transcriptional regulator YiaG